MLNLIIKTSKLQIASIVIFVTSAFILVSSCKNENAKPVISTNKAHENAEIKTIENMQSAYKGEMTATAKYDAFAKKAELEGYHYIALLYNAVSAAESIHARNHKVVIEDAGSSVPIITPEFIVKTTKESLYDDINGEAYEAKTMYPEFLKTAELAGNQIAYLSLTYAMKTEAKHKIFFEKALGDINSNTLQSLPPAYFVCPACGNTYTAAPKHCDFSLTEGDKFMKFQ